MRAATIRGRAYGLPADGYPCSAPSCRSMGAVSVAVPSGQPPDVGALAATPSARQDLATAAIGDRTDLAAVPRGAAKKPGTVVLPAKRGRPTTVPTATIAPARGPKRHRWGGRPSGFSLTDATGRTVVVIAGAGGFARPTRLDQPRTPRAISLTHGKVVGRTVIATVGTTRPPSEPCTVLERVPVAAIYGRLVRRATRRVTSVVRLGSSGI